MSPFFIERTCMGSEPVSCRNGCCTFVKRFEGYDLYCENVWYVNRMIGGRVVVRMEVILN